MISEEDKKRATLMFLYSSTYSDMLKCKRRRDPDKVFALEIFIDQLKILQKIMIEDFGMSVTFTELPKLKNKTTK